MSSPWRETAILPNHADTATAVWSTYQTTYQQTKSYSDDGSGTWRGIAGTIDYATGACSPCKRQKTMTIPSTRLNGITGEFAKYQLNSTNDEQDRSVQRRYGHCQSVQSNSLSHSPYTENLTSPELTIDLLPLIRDPLLPGSLVFSWNGETYFDRDGDLYKSISTSTNAGVQVGAIDYTGGVATLASYPSGTFQSAAIEAAATLSAGFQVETVAFRTAGSPIRPGSLQLTAVRIDNGDSTTAQYNTINYPVEVTNKGAIYGKWALIFTSATSFQVLGIIASGNTAADTTPNNPENGVPYFTIKSEGWGSGWAVGNVVRFNTDGLLAPVWICRTVLAGQGTVTNDKFTLQIRGDAD